eukprot:2628043-Prymnesium_polylepis.1
MASWRGRLEGAGKGRGAAVGDGWWFVWVCVRACGICDLVWHRGNYLPSSRSAARAQAQLLFAVG